ncbi:Imidazole glycerol phosphate synthase amidotransferase subunit HisH [Olavius sp. associated proteobacterium Delta 1]|nr:Imidazole glycerol phosphate synthase amidotransferase subunit HisH [Olavius sp. associated proteobacterium Delta 1]
MICIVNYGMGNLGAIQNMLRKIGAESVVSSNGDDIEKADMIILPGVGAFDNGMKNLERLNLLDILNAKVIIKKTPVLGICLGAQLITKRSEEGSLPGLGWLDAETIRFNFLGDHVNHKIPHMGWNTVTVQKASHIFNTMDEESRFYFVHSFHLACNNPKDILTTTTYGYEFVSSFQKGNIIGVQFHPEKSHKFGMKLLTKFAGFSHNA